ncbi:hypothetical protein HMPREF1503_1760 [Olsenella uli MSTE5]|nr:hypothetical protein HMPREF1503_1760 [Olsenella uli MSTE5]
MAMERLEKVELIREKCDVSYEDAKEALDANGDDVLDAIIWLERSGKARTQSAHCSTNSTAQQPVSDEMRAAQEAYQESAKRTDFWEHVHSAMGVIKDLLRKSVETSFVAERNGRQVLSVPVLVMLLGILLWGATIWLVIIGLFLGLRYRFEGVRSVTVDLNGAMDKAADAAETIKRDLTGND